MSKKTGIVIPSDLVGEVDRLVRDLGYTSRSRLVQDALRHYISTLAWRMEVGRAVGVLAVLYNHEVHGAEEKITDIQHEHLDTIISSLHIHLTRERCLQLVVVRGDIQKIKELHAKLNSVRGVISITPIIVKEA